VDCPTVPEPVYIDRDMWEKIVLNLLSNAFKFTFEGEIEVSIRADSSCAILSVRDSGVGIPAEEMPRLFERFHRIPNMRSRTHEGSGIGLALVQELVKLHNGSVNAESRLGEGTTFFVRVPFGKDHLPANRIGGVRTLASTAMGAAPFVEEALRWLPDAPNAPESEFSSLPEMMHVPCPPGNDDHDLDRPRILVADDNADMRHYLTRLLAERYRVEAVPDGQAALDAARERHPDLILSDVMMPLLDGLELVQRLRADPGLREVPVILLSARAGEESRIQGMETGADDYLVKPFSARELLARVQTHLELARVRKEAEEALRDSETKYRNIVETAEEGIWIVDMDNKTTFVNPKLTAMLGYSAEELLGRRPREFVGVESLPVTEDSLKRHQKGAMQKVDIKYRKKDGSSLWCIVSAKPLLDHEGKYAGSLAMITDISERKRAEEALRATEELSRRQLSEIESIYNSTGAALAYFDTELRYIRINDRMAEINGVPAADHIGKKCRDIVPDLADLAEEMRNRIVATGQPVLNIEFSGTTPSQPGIKRYWIEHWVPLKDEEGRVIGITVVADEITERKRAVEALRESEARYRSFFENSIDAVLITAPDGSVDAVNVEACHMFGMTEDEFKQKGRIGTMDLTDPRLRPALEERARTGKFRGELNCVRKDGTIFPCDIATSFFTDGNGKIKTTGIIRDITERKRAEDALRKSEYQMARAQQVARMGSWEVDVKTNTVTGSRGLYEMWELSQESWTMDAFTGKIHPDDQGLNSNSINAAIYNGKPYDEEFRLLTSKGVRIIHSTGKTIYDEIGHPTTFFGIVQDITERKRAEEALRESEANLAKSQEIAHIGSWEMDLKTSRITRSAESYRIFGYAPGEGLTDFKDFLDRIVPEDRDRVASTIRSTMETGLPYNNTYHIQRTDGEIRIMASIGKVIRDSSGRIIKLHGTNQDITERKQVEEELKAAKMQAELYLDLMGHDINNMHQIALGYLELARGMQADEGGSEFLVRPIEVLQRSALLIQNVRKLQKLKDDVFQTQRVDVAKVLSDVYLEYDVVTQKAVTLNLNGYEHCYVKANELLHDVFANLVSNAIKHTGDDTDIVIDMDVVKDGGNGYCRVMIEDNGPGIPDDLKGKVFNRMLRGTTHVQGMGLGLYLVKSLVESYGGRVWVGDRVSGDHSKGARFMVLLPVVEP